jgi:hypothetical protein
MAVCDWLSCQAIGRFVRSEDLVHGTGRETIAGR